MEHTRAKDKLESHCAYAAKGAQVRSRAQWYEDGERNTKYFLGLEKKRSTQNVISKLIADNGKPITSLLEILQEEVKFYKQLYKSRQISQESVQNYLKSIKLDHVVSTDQQQLLLEGELTSQECVHALKKMKLNKSQTLLV